MVSQKDGVLAVLGTSAAIAGFVLVFFGLTLSTLERYDAETPETVVRRYKWLATCTATAFLFGIGSVALCVWWLAGDQQSALYGWSVALLLIQLALLVGCASWLVAVIVWGT